MKFKLKCFSGNSPRLSGEVDYHTWQAQAKEMMEDTEISDKSKEGRLLPPALKVVLGASIKAPSEECFEILEKHMEVS